VTRLSRPPVAAGLAALAAALSACAYVPVPPGPVPTDWVPEVSPSPLPSGSVGDLGLTPEQNSAVRVRNDACDGLATGSGFVLDEHTVVTNRHVVDDYAEIEITLSDGTTLDASGVRIAVVGDLAVVSTDATLEHAVTLGDDLEIGDTVTIVGYPSGEELTVDTGSVLQAIQDSLGNSGTVYATSAPGIPGSSGSAVYGADGTVVGILYAGDDHGDSLILPVSLLRDFLDDPADQKTLAPSCTS
jgi:S1-C subfamily serine protease